MSPPKCSFCGSPVEAADAYCPQCGKLIDEFQRIYGVQASERAPWTDPRKPLLGQPYAGPGAPPPQPRPIDRGPQANGMEWYDYRDAPMVLGGFAAFIAGAIALGAGLVKRNSIQRAAERVYNEECRPLRSPGVEWCAGGVELGKRMLTPFWAESLIVTTLVTAVITFIVVLLAVQSLRSR